MHKYLIFIVLMISVSLNGQITGPNLIPNGSFEEVDTCGQFNSLLAPNVKHWFSPNENSPDLFFDCELANYGETTPPFIINDLVFQNPYHGENFIGLLLETYVNVPSEREYLGVKLKNELIKDEEYVVTLFINLPDLTSGYCKDCVQLYLDKDSIFEIGTNKLNINNSEFVSSNHDYMKDTTNWKKISYKFVATGIERYLYIGFYDEKANLDGVEEENGVLNFYYYFVDSVSLYQLQNENGFEIELPNIFTPNYDAINDYFKPLNSMFFEGLNLNLLIYNRWGKLVYESNSILWNGTNQKGEKLPTGIYYYTITGDIEKSGKVHLIR